MNNVHKIQNQNLLKNYYDFRIPCMLTIEFRFLNKSILLFLQPSIIFNIYSPLTFFRLVKQDFIFKFYLIYIYKKFMPIPLKKSPDIKTYIKLSKICNFIKHQIIKLILQHWLSVKDKRIENHI